MELLFAGGRTRTRSDGSDGRMFQRCIVRAEEGPARQEEPGDARRITGKRSHKNCLSHKGGLNER